MTDANATQQPSEPGRTPSRDEVEELMADVLGGNHWDAEVWQAAGRVLDLFGITDDESTPLDANPALRTCVSCGSQLPEAEMRHPLSFSVQVLEDKWECLDAEACWEAFRG